MKISLQIGAALLAFLTTAFSMDGAVRYVNVNNANPTQPYTNWITAANVIQDAVEAAVPGDEIVVTNGVYETGVRSVDGYGPSRVAITKPLTVRSVNGPDVTVIRGNKQFSPQDMRCVYLTNGAILSGFTLTNGLAIPLVWANSISAEARIANPRMPPSLTALSEATRRSFVAGHIKAR
jgi:hypothetical protein